MRYSSILPVLGALILLSAVGCSTKEPKVTRMTLSKPERRPRNTGRKRNACERNSNCSRRPPGQKGGRGNEYGGIEPQVVAAWEKAGTRFGWFTNVQFGVLDLIDQPTG